MKPKLLIVTEDLIEIQTFSGRFGHLYARIYQLLLNLKVNLIVFFFKFNYDVTILSNYSDQLNPGNMPAYQSLAWKIYKRLEKLINQADADFSQFKGISLLSLWRNKIASRLMNYYLSYAELLTRLISSGRFPQVLILGNSVPEQIARFLVGQYQLKLHDFSAVNLNWVTKSFFGYFRRREIAQKIIRFKHQSQLPQPGLTEGATLLSVDLYRHLKTLIPVYKELTHLGTKAILVTDEPLINTYLSNAGAGDAECLFLASFLPEVAINKIERPGKEKTNRIYQKVIASVAAKPRNMESLILKLFFPELGAIIADGLTLSCLYLTAGDNLFKKMKPKRVVVAADIRLIEVGFSYLAKLYQVPSLTVSPRMIMFPDEPYQYDLTDYYSVPGEAAKNQLIKLHVPIRKIIVSGDPRFDYFENLSKRFSAKKALQRLGITVTDKKIILLISERPNLYFPKNEKRDFFLMVSQSMRQQKNLRLIVKPHPTEKRYRLMEELKQWGITNFIVSDNQKIELFDLLRLSSVVVMVWSMTGFEAMMLKKPVIIANPHRKDFDKYIPYLKNKAAVEANTESDLSHNLSIYTNHQNTKTKKLIVSGLNFAESYIMRPDGQAAKRIGEFILGQLSRRQ